MINATLRKLKYSELYERLFDQESDKESPTSLYNILLLAAIIGCMAIDTSICERGFSLMNMLKTAKRSRMGIPLLRMLMKICTLGEVWKDPSQIPASDIVDLWREQASSGRFANSYIWGAEALLDARAQMWRPPKHRDVSYMCQLHVSYVYLSCPDPRSHIPVGSQWDVGCDLILLIL